MSRERHRDDRRADESASRRGASSAGIFPSIHSSSGPPTPDNPSPVTDGRKTDTEDVAQGRDPVEKPGERYRDILEDTKDIVYIVDARGKIVYLNRAVEASLGYAPEELIGTNFKDIIVPTSYTDAALIFKRQLSDQHVGPFDLRFQAKGGSVVVIEANERLVWKEGRVVEVRGIGRDVTGRRSSERRLIENEARCRLLVDKANDIIYQTDINGRFTFFNASAVRTTGYNEQEITAKHYLDLVRPDFRHMARRFYERQFAKRIPDTYLEIPIVTKGGDLFWLGQNVQIIWEHDRIGDRITGFSGIARDITDRRHAEDALRESEQRYREIIENIEEGYYEVDLAGNFTFFNDSMARILGYPRERMTGMNNREFMDKQTAKMVFETFHSVYETSVPARALDWELIRKDGQKSFVEVSVSLITDPMGKPVGFRGIARDITERKKFEEDLRRLSITDELTGLFNQRHFYTRIEQESKRAARMRYSLCLILFDLDNFKSYNDTYGHLAGDEVLKRIGKIALRCIREGMDTAFRYGGDEFAVILPSISEEGARLVANRIREEVLATLKGIDMSIGVSALGEDCSVTDLVRTADDRMYVHKGVHKEPTPQ